MDIKLEKNGKTLLCIFENPRWDYKAVRKNEDFLIKEFSGKSKIIFDLKNVEFITSAFVRICLEVVKIVGKGNFKILNTQEFVKTVFKTSLLDKCIDLS
jgi:anti-anti-sigma factor